MKRGGPLLLLVIAGAALRAVQYFRGGSLWVDEAALALNLAARSFSELFSPLDLAQAAPAGFLAVEKALLVAFGRGELALRLFPFLASLAALFLFLRLATGPDGARRPLRRAVRPRDRTDRLRGATQHTRPTSRRRSPSSPSPPFLRGPDGPPGAGAAAAGLAACFSRNPSFSFSPAGGFRPSRGDPANQRPPGAPSPGAAWSLGVASFCGRSIAW